MKSKLRESLFEIAEFNYDSYLEKMDCGIFDGSCGLSLFFFCLYNYTQEEKYYKKSQILFENSFHKIDPSILSLSHGASGIMWTLNHFSKEVAFNSNYEEYLNAYDTSLFDKIEGFKSNIDTMHGLLSIANYLFSRDTKIAHNCLRKIFEIVDANKIIVKEGCAWKGNEDVEVDDKEQYFSFGYAHGIPAILYFLSCFIQKNIETEKALDLFNKGMNYLLYQKNTKCPTYFPTIIIRNEIRRTERISYCYGDLGIACGLTAIANKMKDSKLLLEAREIANNIAEISIPLSQDVSDIGLCHGAAGNGFMFLKLYETHKLEILKEASYLQYKRLLSLKKKGTGIVGYTSTDYDSNRKTFYDKTDPGFINGTAGVGLSIIAYLTNGKIHEWDKILYLE